MILSVADIPDVPYIKDRYACQRNRQFRRDKIGADHVDATKSVQVKSNKQSRLRLKTLRDAR